MAKESKTRKLGRGDMLAACLAAALYLNFLIDSFICIFAIGKLFLEPVFGILTGVLLLAGLVCFPITGRMGAEKLWRRVFFGGIAANLLVVVLFAAVCTAMFLAWA